jgi:hypothetical protein
VRETAFQLLTSSADGLQKKTRDSGGSLADRLCHRLALEDVERVSLTFEELTQLATHLEAMAGEDTAALAFPYPR